MMSFSILFQYLLPKHLLSRLLGILANIECSRLKRPVIAWYIRKYQVNLQESEIQDVDKFKNFNDFFTRALRPELRPLAIGKDQMIVPVDGCVSEFGNIRNQTLLQAKGRIYSLASLLANHTETIQQLQNGSFITFYLAPGDYHRIHMPFPGQLIGMHYVPGKLFSVNASSVQHIDHLFARNERVICVFATAHGLMTIILVGALIVGSIATAWHGVVKKNSRHQSQHWTYRDQNIHLNAGDELGRFLLGSTVIVLTEKTLAWNSAIALTKPVRFGQAMATL